MLTWLELLLCHAVTVGSIIDVAFGNVCLKVKTVFQLYSVCIIVNWAVAAFFYREC